mmetsp:Transcript_21620/g.60098  ORF Transcript_21620/g.60098 Transcript_21620/m.60098 type:complete len:96 (-) Transcript_21620:1139-1426(-)
MERWRLPNSVGRHQYLGEQVCLPDPGMGGTERCCKVRSRPATMAARAGTALAGTALAGRRKWRAKAFLQRASEAFLQAGTVWKALPVEEATLEEW